MSEVLIDFSKTCGKIKPMNCLNNGPTGHEVRAVSNFRAYKNAHIPYARTHDTAFQDEHLIDVHRIFKNFDADETDPASYVFGPTDEYIALTFAAGTKIFYRLGASIEHSHKVGTCVPKDFDKYARICEHIVRHYTENWANGFQYDIEYWEIWNEADCKNPDGSNPCWQGTDEEFIHFYGIVASHLKKCFPHLKIGGPAFTRPKRNYEFVMGFLNYVKDNNIPLDFFSYHRYANTPKIIYEAVKEGESVLEEAGLEGTMTILNEWNYIRGWLGEDWVYSLRSEKSLKGASFVLGSMCAGQASSLGMLMYYEGRPCGMCGIFDTDTYAPLKPYYSFVMFHELYSLGTWIRSEYEQNDIYVCAAAGEKDRAVILTYYIDDDEAPEKVVDLQLRNVIEEHGVKVSIYRLDENQNNELVGEEYFMSKNFNLRLKFRIYTSYLIKIIAM